MQPLPLMYMVDMDMLDMDMVDCPLDMVDKSKSRTFLAQFGLVLACNKSFIT